MRISHPLHTHALLESKLRESCELRTVRIEREMTSSRSWEPIKEKPERVPRAGAVSGRNL
jgi:hypothetical protein